MKKIAFITRVLSSGGAEKVLMQIVNACARQGMECLILTTWKNERQVQLHPGVRVVELEQFGDSLKGKIKQYGQARKLVREFGAELVLSMPEDIGIYVIPAMLGTGIPVVVSERNNPWVMPHKKISRILRRMVYPFADGLIFQTERAASFFPKSQQKKGIILDNPLDVSRLPEMYTGVREKMVIGAGRLAEQKNFPLLIRSFAQFHKDHPDYRLTIYGIGPKKEELEALAAQLLPEGSWSLPGRTEDLPGILSRSAIFALSSDYEGVPNVLIEAMAVGTPAVTTDCAPGGAAALVKNGVNGLLVPVGDTQALANGLCALADDPEKAAQMAQEAVGIRQRLDADRVCRDWLNYLQRIAKSKGGRK